MKRFISCSAIIFLIQICAYAQTSATKPKYAHKVVVEEILQTNNYTYLRVKEIVKGKDSIQWMAAPKFLPVIGDTYYYQSGLQMGEFKSKELDRTFSAILFLSEISTNPEIGGTNMLAGIPIAPKDTTKVEAPLRILHTVVIKEVIQTSGYSYLRAKEGDNERWLALVKIPAKVGQTYTYDDASPMKDFASKELKKTFKEVFFLSSLKLIADVDGKSPNDSQDNNQKKINVKKDNKIPVVAGITLISKLLENKKTYSGKAVTIKGKVTKYSSDILSKNWIHIEDGTDFSGKYDLTVTIDQAVKVGDEITVQGKISLDKDFGSGYFFDIIMEDATIQNK